MSGVWVDDQVGAGQSAGHVGGVTAVDHQVVVAVGHEDRLSDGRQIVGSGLAGVPDCPELGDAGLDRDPLIAVLSALLEAIQVVSCGPFAPGVRGKNRKFLGSLRVRAALR